MLLTRCATLLPPNHADIEFKPDNAPLIQGLTYGGDVFGQVASEYDETLRILIMWCMSKCLPLRRSIARKLASTLYQGELGACLY